MTATLPALLTALAFLLVGAVAATLAWAHALERWDDEHNNIDNDYRRDSSRCGGAPDREHWHQADADTPAENNDGRFDSSAQAEAPFSQRVSSRRHLCESDHDSP